MNSLLLTDGYKTGHHRQYPKCTTLVYSNLTPRSNRHAHKGIDKVLSFGHQYAIRWIDDHFNKHFFNQPKETVIKELKTELSLYLNQDYDVSHFEDLHDLGFLPIEVKAIEEGVELPMRVPVLTIKNTIPKFYWITNYLETILSALTWLPMNSATIALHYKRIFHRWAKTTDKNNLSFIDFQGHDFSMRGMGGVDAVIASALGHAIVFSGSDSLPSIHAARQYYKASGFVVGSVNATEHSVMCAGRKEDEFLTFKRLIEDNPTGILSIVSDTWDLWKVLTDYLPRLKDDIMARYGKVVIRPDSGDPVRILTGWEKSEMKQKHWDNMPAPEKIGVVELLWDVFGGTINDQGFKVLDPHIGAIYGDSITPERAEDICSRLYEKRFASTNVVLGIGSFTYQHNTRDTLGFAVKATYVVVNGEERIISKDPVTDDGTKKSAAGLLQVFRNDKGELELKDRCTREEEKTGELKTIYRNGLMVRFTDWSTIKSNVNKLL